MRENNLLRGTLGLGAIAVSAFLLALPAIAQDDGEVSIGFAKYVEPSPDEPRWVVCYSVDFGAKKNYVGSIIPTQYRDTVDNNGDVRWREKLKEQFDLDKSLYGGCNIEKSAKDAQWRYGVFVEFHPRHPKELILVDWQMKPPAAKGKSKGAGASTRRGKSVTEPTAEKPASPKYVEVAGPNGTIRLSPEVAARNQAAADDYRRKMDEFARAKAEHERTLALHQQSQANAATEQRDYEQKLAMNDTQVAAHGAAMAQHAAATKPPAKGAKGWMYCEAIGEIGGKSRYYSTIAQVDYVPGEITIIDVMARNRAAFKAYLAGTHKVFFGTDTLLHCPYSTDDLAEAQGYEARDKRGDGNNGIVSIQTGWAPTS